MVFLFILVGTFDLISYHSAESKISFFFFPLNIFQPFWNIRKNTTSPGNKSLATLIRFLESKTGLLRVHTVWKKKNLFFFYCAHKFKKMTQAIMLLGLKIQN